MLPLERPRPPTPAERALLEVLADDALAAQIAASGGRDRVQLRLSLGGQDGGDPRVPLPPVASLRG